MCAQVFRERLTNPAATIPQPATGAELEAFCDVWPDRAHEVLPADDWVLESVGLSRHTGRNIEPYSIEWFERLLATVEKHSTLVRSLNVLLRRADAEVAHG